nr:reverse transcriptase domain-containing protein [Tanacetum cinerariifolium]
MVPRKILTRSGPISLNTAKQSQLNVVSFCCSRQVNTARPKGVINAVRTNQVNDVKASACWVWRPIKPNSALITLKRYDYVDVRGRTRLIKSFYKIAKSLAILTQKCKTFDWGEEQELTFQTFKDKLCNEPVLALPNGPEDFLVYYDASKLGLGYVLMQRELFSDYDCEIRYHPCKENVVANALSKKERVKPKRVRAMNMTF